MRGGSRNIFVIGASIIKQAVPVFKAKLSKDKYRGLNVINMAQKGGGVGQIIGKLNSKQLEDSREDEICVISFLGNEPVV